MVLRMQEITLPLPENYGIGLILITRPWLLRIAHKTTSNFIYTHNDKYRRSSPYRARAEDVISS